MEGPCLVDAFGERVGEERGLSERYVLYNLKSASLTDIRDDGLVERDRCQEELALLQFELARLIRWSDRTFKTLESSIQAWEKKVTERKAWCEEYGKAVEEGDVERRNELDRVVPGRYYL